MELNFFFLEQWKITETANLCNMWNVRTHQGNKYYGKINEEKAGGICWINGSIKKGNETVQRGRIKCFVTSTEYSYEDCDVPVEEIFYALLEEAAVVRNEKCRQRHKHVRLETCLQVQAICRIHCHLSGCKHTTMKCYPSRDHNGRHVSAVFVTMCHFFTYK
jgi:hypothetical protein